MYCITATMEGDSPAQVPRVGVDHGWTGKATGPARVAQQEQDTFRKHGCQIRSSYSPSATSALVQRTRLVRDRTSDPASLKAGGLRGVGATGVEGQRSTRHLLDVAQSSGVALYHQPALPATPLMRRREDEAGSRCCPAVSILSFSQGRSWQFFSAKWIIKTAPCPSRIPRAS